MNSDLELFVIASNQNNNIKSNALTLSTENLLAYVGTIQGQELKSSVGWGMSLSEDGNTLSVGTDVRGTDKFVSVYILISALNRLL
ncbi:hypothetical protein [Photobacterium proteolyticum]|uniref:hypothetical protein n=1 Tax=Photobacterium proteolyticum TaxID=1903952 RepID=UPI0011153166|nr:hypothetical protein [Photobacterium proteolyticum]